MIPTNFAQAYAQYQIARNTHELQQNPINHPPKPGWFEVQELGEVFTGMVRALELTERNLTSLIDARRPDAVLLSHWRDEVRNILKKASAE